MHILHVGFADTAEPDTTKIEEIFNEADSWLRYATNCWLLWTDLSAGDWTGRLESVIEKEKRHFFICQLNMNDRSGWLQKATWDWIHDHEQRLVR